MSQLRVYPAKWHLFLVCAICLCTASGRLLFKSWYTEQARHYERKMARKGAEERAAAWRRLRYVDATDPVLPDSFLTRIKAIPLKLSLGQQATLEKRLRQIVCYLQSPTFEEYYALRTAGLQFRFAPNARARDLLTRKTDLRDNLLASDPKAFTALLWGVIHDPRAHGGPPCLTAICLDNIAATTSSENTPFALMGGKVRKGFTAARAAINPGFDYADGEANFSNEIKGELYLQLSFFGKVNGSTNAGPIYISLQWLPANRNWAPSQMISDLCVDIDTLF